MCAYVQVLCLSASARLKCASQKTTLQESNLFSLWFQRPKFMWSELRANTLKNLLSYLASLIQLFFLTIIFLS